MNPKVKELRQLVKERRELSEKLKPLAEKAEKRELTPEEQAQFDDLSNKLTAIDQRVVALEEAIAQDPEDDATMMQNSQNLDDLQKRFKELEEKVAKAPAPRFAAPYFVKDLGDKQAKADNDLALRGWALGKKAGDKHREAAKRVGLDIESDTITIKRGYEESLETRAQSTSATAGGYTIPQGFMANLEKKTAFYNPLRSVARVIKTSGVGALPWPTVDDTSNTSALTAENTATSATDFTFGQVSLSAYTYKTLALLSNELMQDTGLNLEEEISTALGERIGRSEAAAFATGTGSSQPQGVVTGASAGVTAASATAIALSDIVGLMGSLDWSYQANASFMMHQAIWFAILKLVDSQSRPLVANVIDGNQPRLYGYPVVINNNMASTIATTNKTMLFGDFSKFIIREAGELTIQRLNELYAASYQTGFLAVGRRDSRVLQSAALKLLTQA